MQKFDFSTKVGESGKKWKIILLLQYNSYNATMTQLHGEYELKMDAKGRLMIPTALKKQLPEADKDSFFINRGFEKCCVLYPAKEWKIIATEIDKLSDYIQKERTFKRYFLRGASKLEMDAASRILIPKPLQEFANLQGELVLLAYGNKIEIWNKAEYDKMLSEEPSDFSALAEEVMSKRKKEDESSSAKATEDKDGK